MRASHQEQAFELDIEEQVEFSVKGKLWTKAQKGKGPVPPGAHMEAIKHETRHGVVHRRLWIQGVGTAAENGSLVKVFFVGFLVGGFVGKWQTWKGILGEESCNRCQSELEGEVEVGKMSESYFCSIIVTTLYRCGKDWKGKSVRSTLEQSS